MFCWFEWLRCGVKDFIGAGSGAKRKKRYALQGSILSSLRVDFWTMLFCMNMSDQALVEKVIFLNQQFVQAPVGK